MPSSFVISCKRAILLVIGIQAVVQLVKTKSATHHLPSKSAEPQSSSSCDVYVNSAISFDIFVSISGPLLQHAAKMTRSKDNNKVTIAFFIYTLLISSYI